MPDNSTSSPPLFEAITALRGLKERSRAGWLLRGVKNVESVADHSWRAGIIAYVLAPEGYDREKMLRMGVLHDISEINDRDYTPLDGISKEEKEKREQIAVESFLKTIPEPQRSEWRELNDEFEARETKESKFVKEVEVLEMVFQALEYENDKNYEKHLTEFLMSTEKRITIPVLKEYWNEIKKRWPKKALEEYDPTQYKYHY